jgi:AMP deaminase
VHLDPNHQLFYFWANVRQLNLLRLEKGMNTFDIRPHAGESGSPLHLATTYLLARGINHGVNLQKEAVLEYLYYVDQVSGLLVQQVSLAHTNTDYSLPTFYTWIPTTRLALPSHR